jgi:hypothetical protein
MRAGGEFGGRPDARGGADFRGRPDVRGGADSRGRPDVRGGADFRGRPDGRAPIGRVSRPLITRAGSRGFRGAPVFRAGGRFGLAGLPFGWEHRVVFHGFFPLEYASYCEPVPVEYDYMLPPEQPYYDPCLFGDRVIVVDRFSRSIVFVATI